MRAEVEIGGVRYRTDLSHAFDLSTPIAFSDTGDAGPASRVQAFGLPHPTSQPFAFGSHVLDTQKGSGVNCRTLTLTPHGNGTHTESVSHIVNDEVAVRWAAPQGLVPAAVLTVPAVKFAEAGETYGATSAGDDDVISGTALTMARRAASIPDAFLQALIIRTGRPAPTDGQWTSTNPPYCTEDATLLLRQWQCEHLVLDVPSIDREDDGGLTVCHHLFWEVPPGHRLDAAPARRTITEMAVVPEDVADGTYLLNLQVPPLLTDAAPSRPLLFSAELV